MVDNMNILALQAAAAVLLLAIMFGVPLLRNNAKFKSFTDFIINLDGVILMYFLIISEGSNYPAGWILLLFVTAIFIGKTILYFRGKTG